MEKKNNLTIVSFIVIIIVIIVVVVVFILKNNINDKSKIETPPITPIDIQLDQAVTTDTTKAIIENLNNIDLEDTTDTELNTVDQELKKL
jgi:hypothetical protein